MKVTFELDTNNTEEMDLVIQMLSGSPVGKTPEVGKTAEVDGDASAAEAEEQKKAEAAKKAAAAAASKKAREKKKAEADAAAKAEAEAEAKAQAEASEEFDLDEDDDEAAPAHTKEDVRSALKKFAAAKDKASALKILKDAGASSMSELTEDMFADVMAAIKKAS
ncbi:hypothetical protein P67b_00053 [Ruegeria phage Tedan]|nr:hypothetical protein P67b_00053 [Ruegeria phage Tedan]